MSYSAKLRSKIDTAIPELDNLTWVEGISILSYGLRIGLRANKRGVIKSFLQFLPPGWKRSNSSVVDRLYSIVVGEERTGHRKNKWANIVYADAEVTARTPYLHQAIDGFESDLQLYVAEMSPRRLFVHAGVVAVGGKAVLIPGRSFSGKTTLTAEFVKAGAIYYSDEYAVLDSSGRVHHYARPLSIRHNGYSEKPSKHKVESLGGRAGVKPLPVGMVIVSNYKPGATWRPRELTAGEGVLALMANTVSARRKPERVLSILNLVSAHAPVLKGTRGEADQVVDYVFEELGR